MKNKLAYIGIASLFLSFTACESPDNEFPDFDYQTVYFANQYALRTIELGEEEFVDNTLDNQHKVMIKAAWGGGYTNRKNVIIDYVVEESLCDRLYFKGTDTPVTPMPASYYTLASNQIKIPVNEISGGVEVQLTDAFFADAKAISQYYVIPLRMTGVQGADSILQGKTLFASPVWTNAEDWNVLPKNYVLYAVKYANLWHGQYLRRGVDQVTIDGTPKQVVRHAEFVEKDESVDVNTAAYKEDLLTMQVKDNKGIAHSFTLRLTFNDEGACTVTSGSQDVTASGSGKFVSKGEKKSLGGKDRDAIYLEYNVDLNYYDKDYYGKDLGKNVNLQTITKDTLVLRTRNVVGAASFGVERK